MARLRSLWRNLVHRGRVERDLDDEIRVTFELLVGEKVGQGMDPDSARRAARLEMGSVDSLKEDVRDVRSGAHVDVLLQDVRYALRLLRRAPGFGAVAIVTMALGIGVNAAVFGVVKSVLLDPLPYADADRLMRVYGRTLPGARGTFLMRAAQVDAIVQRQRSFESVAAFDSARDAVYGDEGDARIVRVAWVEPHLFRTLGVSAALGRTFVDDDRATGYVPASGAERGTDTARAVVLAHEAWQGLLAADPAVVGREVRVNGIPRTVVGVLPRGFVGLRGEADFYFAFDLAPALTTGAGWLGAVGRLKPGVSPEAAEREIAVIWASEYPDENEGGSVTAMPLRDAMVGDVRRPLLVLLASTATVLLMACANLASALLSRALARRREFAVRAALGAGRKRLVRQLLTETIVLALAGGALGLVLAQATLALLRAHARAVLPAHAELSLDAGAVVVMAVVAFGGGLAFGLAPALSVGRWDAVGSLRGDGRGASEGRRPRRLRGLLVAGQVALCASLLVAAFLLARSLWAMAAVPLGFEPRGVLTARVRLATGGYPTLESRTRFYEQLLDRLRLLPGVESVAVANKAPTMSPRRDPLVADGAPPSVPEVSVAYATVSDDYFRTLRIPLLEGRTFDSSDRAGAPATAVVSESLARRFLPGALGARIRLGGDPVTVVGVVGDVRNDPLRPEVEPMAYRSRRQESTHVLSVLLRTRGDPLSFERPLQREVAALDPSLPLQQPMALDRAVGDGLAVRRLPVALMTAFGALALLLASVGVYAMFASLAAAREREFGVRMALGSRRAAIAGLLLWQGCGWMVAGLSGGTLGVLLVVKLLRGWLYGVPPFDPIALGASLAMLIGCGALALLVPLARAMRVDPAVTLRVE